MSNAYYDAEMEVPHMSSYAHESICLISIRRTFRLIDAI